MSISSIVSGQLATASGGGKRIIAQTASTISGAAVLSVNAKAPSSVQIPNSTVSGQVAHAVKQVNDAFAQKGQNLYATIEKDKTSGIDVVKIVDGITHQVVAQYPAKAIVAMADAMAQPAGASGQLMNVSA